MNDQNGILAYEPGQFPNELKSLSLNNLWLPWGIKFIDVKGKSYWIPATKEDVLAAESQRLGRPLNDAELNACDSGCGPCAPGLGTCRGYANIAQKLYYCVCSVP